MAATPLPENFVVRSAPDSRPKPVAVPTPQRDPADSGQVPLPFDPFQDEPAQAHTVASAEVPPVADVRQWSATLALAVFETLHGRRPVGQLTRWVDDRVQSAIAFHRRRSLATASARPALVRSVRVQYPRPDAAEICAHLSLNGRSYALALRLEVWGGHWLCVALAF